MITLILGIVIGWFLNQNKEQVTKKINEFLNK